MSPDPATIDVYWRLPSHGDPASPRDAALGTRRISLVFFHQPNYDALIECLPSCQGPGNPAKYPPITSGEHRNRKFAATTIVS